MARKHAWLAAYGTFSVSIFGMTLLAASRTSFDYLMLMQELTDGVNLTILLNFVICVFFFGGILSLRVLFGELRIIEVEHIADQLPFYGLSLLFILFNDENLLLNIIWTGLTVLSKIHHIIVFDRIDFLQLRVVNGLSSHPKTKLQILGQFLRNGYIALLSSYIIADIAMAKILAYDVFQGVSSMGSLLFGIQFGVMGIEGFSFWGKMVLNTYELIMYRAQEVEDTFLDGIDEEDDDIEELVWENKALYTQVFEIACTTLKAWFHAVFLYMLYFHAGLTLPLLLIQGFVVASHSAFKQMVQLKSYFSLAKYLEKLLADATQEELDAADRICIICREDMSSPDVYLQEKGKPLAPRRCPKKLQCGHVLHMGCLKDWLERSDNCPLCRQKVFPTGAAAAEEQVPTQVPPTPEPTEGLRPPIPTVTTLSLPREGEHAPSNSVTPAPLPANFTSRTTPTDWIALPMTKSGPGQFTINLTPNNTCTLSVRSVRDSDIETYTLQQD